MNFIKGVCLSVLLLGAAAQGMNNQVKKDLKKDLVIATGFIDKIWQNKNLVGQAIKECAIPALVFDVFLEEKLQKDDQKGWYGKKAKDVLFTNQNEYQWSKYGAYFLTMVAFFKPQITQFLVKETTYNKIANIGCLSFIIAKLGTLVYNYSIDKQFANKEYKPSAAPKKDGVDANVYTESVKKYKNGLEDQVAALKKLVSEVGAEPLAVQQQLSVVINDKSTDDDYVKLAGELDAQKKEYVEYINKYLPTYRSGKKLNSFLPTSFIFTALAGQELYSNILGK